MKPNKLIIILLLLIAAINAGAQRYSTVRIVPPVDKQQRADLLGLLEIDHFGVRGDGIIAEISEEQLEKLGRSGYPYEILVADVAARVREQNREYFSVSPSGR